jgi:O-antigen biosynthesis protein
VAPPSVVVYTALLGGYDRLLEQPLEAGTDYLCVTDGPLPESLTWSSRQVCHRARPQRVARWLKTHPHEVAPAHDWTVWIDARVSIRVPDLVATLLDAASASGLAVIASHPRQCLYDEAAKVYRDGFDTSPRLLAQIRRYRRAGYPPGHGLWSTMVLARDNRSPAIRKLNESWHREIALGSVRDQVSLPFVAWRLGVEPAVLPVDPFDNPLFSMHDHVTPRRYPPRWRRHLNRSWFTVRSRVGR